MRLIQNALISLVVVYAAYLIWLSPLALLVFHWPTPTVAVMTFIPILLFVIPGILFRFLRVDEKIRIIVQMAALGGGVFVFLHFQQGQRDAEQWDSIQNEKENVVCSVKRFDVLKKNERRIGYCTFQIFGPNRTKVGRYSTKSNVNDCADSLPTACKDFCGNLTEPGTDQVNRLLVNFGTKENFDEVHLRRTEAVKVPIT